MDKLVLDAEIIEKIYYLYKHLFDEVSEHPTNIPKISPNGSKINSIKQIASVLGTNTTIAAHYVLQDPKADSELKFLAKTEIGLDIQGSSEDSFKAIAHNAFDLAYKSVRLVRTTSGALRFNQPQGSIIVEDGRDPLDALTALPNDIPGYEKLADKDGRVFYIGNENGKWVVRDPIDKRILHTTSVEEDAFSWLNSFVGGSNERVGASDREPTRTERVLENTPRASRGRNIDKESVASDDRNLTPAEARAVILLNNAQLAMYRVLKERGLNHQQAIYLVTSPTPKPKAKK